MHHILLVSARVFISFPSVSIVVAMLSVESVVRGYHVYMNDWSPSVGDEFELEIEELNRHDRYAVLLRGRPTGHFSAPSCNGLNLSKNSIVKVKACSKTVIPVYCNASVLPGHSHIFSLPTLPKLEGNAETGTACQLNFTNE